MSVSDGDVCVLCGIQYLLSNSLWSFVFRRPTCADRRFSLFRQRFSPVLESRIPQSLDPSRSPCSDYTASTLRSFYLVVSWVLFVVRWGITCVRVAAAGATLSLAGPGGGPTRPWPHHTKKYMASPRLAALCSGCLVSLARFLPLLECFESGCGPADF